MNRLQSRHVFRLAILIAPFLVPSWCDATLVSTSNLFRPSAEGAWRYSESPQFQPPGLNASYFPTTTAEYASATFQGYVVRDPELSAITGGATWFGNGYAIFEIFSTYIRSDFDQTIPLNVAGDYGRSLFIDDSFVAGGAFGTPVQIDLILQAGVERKIEMAGYNGPARNWIFVIGEPVSRPLPPDNPQFNRPLETIPGIHINADGVPEPSTAVLVCGLSIVLIRRRCFGMPRNAVAKGNRHS